MGVLPLSARAAGRAHLSWPAGAARVDDGPFCPDFRRPTLRWLKPAARRLRNFSGDSAKRHPSPRSLSGDNSDPI
jgi:hypothetical protein